MIHELQYTNYKDTGLVAYYRMESGALTTDSSGNSQTLTNNNTVGEATGKFGGGADFGSGNTNKYFSRASEASLQITGDLTISAWVYVNDFSQWNIIAAKSSGGTTNYEYEFALQSATAIQFVSAGASDYYFTSATIPTLSTNTWYHVAVKRTSGTIRFYVNGKGYTATVDHGSSGSVAASAQELRIGTRGDNYKFYRGVMDDVAIFNRSASDWEIWNIAQGHSAGEYIPNANTKLYLPLNGNSADVSNNAKNMTDVGTISWVSAKFGQGASATFNKTNYFYNSSVHTSGTGDITMSVWFKKNGAPTGDYTPTIMSLGYNRTDVTNQRFYIVATKTNGYAAFYSFDGSSTNVDSTKNICDDVWHNVIGVRSGTTMNVYVDGALVGTTTGTARNIGAADFRVGNVGDATYDILGAATMDEIIIESTAWSASEISKYYTYAKGRF